MVLRGTGWAHSLLSPRPVALHTASTGNQGHGRGHGQCKPELARDTAFVENPGQPRTGPTAALSSAMPAQSQATKGGGRRPHTGSVQPLHFARRRQRLAGVQCFISPRARSQQKPPDSRTDHGWEGENAKVSKPNWTSLTTIYSSHPRVTQELKALNEIKR